MATRLSKSSSRCSSNGPRPSGSAPSTGRELRARFSEEGFGQGYGFFDDPDAIANGWVARYRHYSMGMIEQFGTLFSLSDTPSTISGPPPVRGQQSREVLHEIGYSDNDVQAFARQGITSWPD